MNQAQSHISIEVKPQLLGDDFDKNCDIAEAQKRVAEAAPSLLAALKEYVAGDKVRGTTASATHHKAIAAIAEAEGC